MGCTKWMKNSPYPGDRFVALWALSPVAFIIICVLALFVAPVLILLIPAYLVYWVYCGVKDAK